MRRFDWSATLAVVLPALVVGIVIVWAVVRIFFAFAVGDNGDWRISR